MNNVIKYNDRDELIEKVASKISNDLANALDSSPVSYTHLTLPTNREV